MVDREAGANSLRGGRNTYSSKCRIGNFVEEEFRPEVQRKGFTKVRGSSSARAALYGHIAKCPVSLDPKPGILLYP